jgi:hypothetical protein
LGDDRLVRVTLCWLPPLALLVGCATSPPLEPATPRAAARAPAPPPAERVEPVLALVESAAQRHGLDVPLVLGVIQIESGFNPQTRSSAGAVGLMQLMPRTAAALAKRLGREGVPIDDPGFNIEAGCLYLELLRERFGGDLELALAAYNTGPYRVAGWRAAGKPLSEGTRRYVDAVLAARRAFAEGGSRLAAARAARAARPPESGEGRRGAPKGPDRAGLRALLRRQAERYPDEPTPASAPASRPADDRTDDGIDELTR